MSFKIAIASGKGGTGKTSVSVCLQHFIKKQLTGKIQLVDCDVEEPNDLLFFPNAKKKQAHKLTQLVPVIDKSKCTFCRKCTDYCEFNAISIIPSIALSQVNSSLCHSCGACLVACEHDAIRETELPIGRINFYQEEDHINLIEGELKIGSAMQTLVIKELKKNVDTANKIILYDAPPGTSCPVVETISDVDFIILVSEPTPFGLHDLKLMVELIKKLNKPFSVIINKVGLGNHDIYDYLKLEQIEILGEIPFTQNFATQYAKGELLNNIPEDISDEFEKITTRLKKEIYA
jgi:MinD superfamily P-loop ATPase